MIYIFFCKNTNFFLIKRFILQKKYLSLHQLVKILLILDYESTGYTFNRGRHS